MRQLCTTMQVPMRLPTVQSEEMKHS